jgi:hypothetical protein
MKVYDDNTTELEQMEERTVEGWSFVNMQQSII